MVSCPKCKEDITYLNAYQKGEMHYNFTDDNWNRWEQEEFQADDTGVDFECPECNERLFTDEFKALTFLKNRTIQTKL